MRVIPTYEKKKRGCQYCMDVGYIQLGNQGKRFGCPHDECPYHVLDKNDTYDQFMASEDSKILVNGFFQTMPSCYELSNGNAYVKGVFSEGSSGVNF